MASTNPVFKLHRLYLGQISSYNSKELHERRWNETQAFRFGGIDIYASISVCSFYTTTSEYQIDDPRTNSHGGKHVSPTHQRRVRQRTIHPCKIHLCWQKHFPRSRMD